MDKFCPYCGKEGKQYIISKDINRKITNLFFYYYNCDYCKLIYLTNIPEDINIYYPDNYYYFPESLEQIKSNANLERNKLEFLQKFKTNGKVIEIGPASGGFAYLAREAGFDISVIEMNEKCCDYLKNVIGLNTIYSDNEINTLEQQGKADVIVLWHVIEHMLEPWKLIEVASKKLNPEGILIIAAPNPDSIQFSILKKFWVHLDAPRHTRLMSKDFIINVANSFELNLLSSTTNDKASILWNKFGWEKFLSNMVPFKILKQAAEMVGTIISYAMYLIEVKEGKGCAYTVVLKK